MFWKSRDESKKRIRKAMKDIGSVSCIRFKDWTGEEDYLHFFAGWSVRQKT